MRTAYKNGDELAGIGNCDSCEMVAINGHPCHETGCPNAWRDETRECGWCGTEFKPEERYQRHCSGSCYDADTGFDDPEDE